MFTTMVSLAPECMYMLKNAATQKEISSVWMVWRLGDFEPGQERSEKVVRGSCIFACAKRASKCPHVYISRISPESVAPVTQGVFSCTVPPVLVRATTTAWCNSDAPFALSS